MRVALIHTMPRAQGAWLTACLCACGIYAVHEPSVRKFDLKGDIALIGSDTLYIREELLSTLSVAKPTYEAILVRDATCVHDSLENIGMSVHPQIADTMRDNLIQFAASNPHVHKLHYPLDGSDVVRILSAMGIYANARIRNTIEMFCDFNVQVTARYIYALKQAATQLVK